MTDEAIKMESYEVGVIGGGHAGIEAALASARLGAETILFTLSLDAVGNTPCNPSIGGTAKGHLVRELDALGGEMGKAADANTIQSRMLNRGKGPAVYSLRAQIDRAAYKLYMKEVLEKQEHLTIRQAEVTEVVTEETENGRRVAGVVTRTGGYYPLKAAVVATGTYLKGKIFMGAASFAGGPDGSVAAGPLSESLKACGIPLRRFKTGTPPRAYRDSIDYSKLEKQLPDEHPEPFSFHTTEEPKNSKDCYIAYTNEETHRVIRANLGRSPLYGGEIVGVGPRYCPSIEDKVVRFPDKKRHQVFVEPMGEHTEEVYLQGLSSSLPIDVQEAYLRTIEGFEQIRLTRHAYAIEYDCCDPLCLLPTLECRAVSGLYGAGQFNGTSGYEEAAVQGLVAGINACRKVRGQEGVTFPRSESYIGTLIDDLVTKGCSDPYRMMTSRSEYRLLLRQDNADLRLTEKGYRIGLVSKEDYEALLAKKQAIEETVRLLEETGVGPTDRLNRMLTEKGTAPVKNGSTLAELLRRPEITLADLDPFCPELSHDRAVRDEAEITVKYAGYIDHQLQAVQRAKKMEAKKIPADFDFEAVKGLRLEAIERLTKIRPESVGRASRISGVSPADIAVLLLALTADEARRNQEK